MATQIKTFALSQLTIGSCSQFHSIVCRFIDTATPAALHIEALEPAYKSAAATLSSIVNRQAAFVATKEMKAADARRDSAAGTISSVVNAYLTTPVDEKRAAANLLSPKLAAYKGIRKHEYSKETAEIKGMLGVLRAEGNAAAVTLLGLDAEVEALSEANDLFEAAFLDKGKEESERMDVSDLKSEDVVNNANSLYGQIVQIVNAYAIVRPTEAITTFITDLNGIIKAYVSIIDGTASGGSAADGDGSTSNPTPEPGGDEGEGGSPL